MTQPTTTTTPGVKSKEILDRIQQAKDSTSGSSTGGFGEGILSNEDVVGNMNSKFMYNQTKDTNNGLQKLAGMENKYLEKLAGISWLKRLGSSIKTADPMAQLAVGSSLTGLGLSASRTATSGYTAKTNAERSKVDRQSIKVLNNLNKTLSNSAIVPTSIIKPINSKGKILEKVAEQVEASKKKSNFHVGAAIGSGIAGSVAMSPLIHVGSRNSRSSLKVIDEVGQSDLGTVKKMMRDNKLNVTFNHRDHAINNNFGKETKGFKNLIKKNARSVVFSSVNTPGSHPGFLNATDFGAKKNFVDAKTHPSSSIFKGNKRAPIKNKDVIMHELGHAKDYKSFGKTKTALGLGSRLGGIASIAALSNDKTRDYAVPIAAASVIPTLRDEVVANYHAYKGIAAHKGKPAANKFLTRAASKNMIGYGLGAATTVGGAYVAKKIMDKWHPIKGKN